MTFVNNKVVIITGGCSGIGLALVKKALEQNAKGVTIADSNPNGNQVAETLAKEYNSSRIKFVPTDVTVKEEFKRAFEETIKAFNNVDILVNAAGILNESIWEKEVAVNINGTVLGCILGFEEYLPICRSGDESVIVNFSSAAGLEGYPNIPVYSATKHAVIGLSRAWGHDKHYNDTKVRVLMICPDATDTPLLREMPGRTLGPRYDSYLNFIPESNIQTADIAASNVLKIIDVGKNGSTWVLENGIFWEAKLPQVADLRPH